MRILGLDIATSTGFSVLDGEKLLVYGLIKLKPEEHIKRFKQFRLNIKELIEVYKPDLVVIEATFSGKNPKSTAYLNMLRGIALELMPPEVIVKTVPVSTARKDVLGKGKKHDKSEVFTWAVAKYKMKDLTLKKHNDITDSILISYWGFLDTKD